MKIFNIIQFIVLIFLSFLIFLSPIQAKSISLDDFVKMVWERNIKLKEYRSQVKIAELSIKQQEGVYDLNLQANLTQGSSYNNSTNLNSYSLGSGLSLTQKLSTGGDLSLNFSGNKTNSLTLPYNANSSIVLSQPLANGLGQQITDYQINFARLNYQKSIQIYLDSIQSLLQNAITEYYSYFINLRLKEVVLKNIDQTKAILDEHKKKAALNLVTAQDVLAAQIEYKKSLADLLSVEDGIIKSQENLSQFINATLEDQQSIIQELVPIEPTTATFNQAEAIATMQKQNPSLRAAQIEKQKIQLSLNYDQNKLLPNISLNLGLGYGSTFQTFLGSSVSSGTTYSMGISFQDFLGKREKSAILEKDQVNLVAQIFNEQSLQNDLRIKLSNAIRTFSVQQKNVEINKEVLGLSSQLLKQQMQKFELGLIQSYELLNNEKSYKSAELSYYEMLSSYLETYYQILVLEGDLLNKYNIQL